jgi:hypothetical protein
MVENLSCIVQNNEIWLVVNKMDIRLFSSISMDDIWWFVNDDFIANFVSYKYWFYNTSHRQGRAQVIGDLVQKSYTKLKVMMNYEM